MKLEIISNRYDRPFGLPRYSLALENELQKAGIDFSVLVPSVPAVIRKTEALSKRLGFDLGTFFAAYPVSAPINRDTVKHFTHHTLATLIWLKRLDNTIVTAHDIQPDNLVFKTQSPLRHAILSMFHQAAMNGLKRARILITDTVEGQRALSRDLGYPVDRIKVIPLGVDHSLFRPQPVPSQFLNGLGIGDDSAFVLHVGTEAPRKNVNTLVKAFALVRAELQDVKLVKVGTPTWPIQYQQIVALIEKLGLKDDVLFVDWVTDEELAMLYNAATVLIYPSLFEGFGLPVIEAMACGTPVITSTTSCLPQVAGGCAVLIDPQDTEALAEAMRRVLADSDLREDMQQRGLVHASRFTWERTAQKTLVAYRELSN